MIGQASRGPEPSRAVREWTCATCGQQATAADWGLLATIGWKLAPDGFIRCSICAKEASQLPRLPAPALLARPRHRPVAP